MESAVDLNVEVSKEFNVPVERLYQAWTSEQDLKQWWHPMENRLKHLTNDLRPGGEVVYTFESNQGHEVLTIKGNYKEVEAGKKLVYTWNWQLPTPAVHNSDFLLTVLFEPAGNGSRLHVKQEHIAHEEALQPHRDGWEKALTNLERYLSQS
jgi:uncharacterized protein YndB with AHSA1/START domain